MKADDIIKKLGLKPHPTEGGYFLETYRSGDIIKKDALRGRYKVDKSAGTAIYYLLTSDSHSAMHRLKTDEIFHFYLGDPVTILLLYPDGSSKLITMGQKISNLEQMQAVIPRDTWIGAFLNEGGEYALMGTTMAPGFDYEDFELGKTDELIKQYPDREELIRRLTK
jgi:predicted cupin superfamily sugar epimerase